MLVSKRKYNELLDRIEDLRSVIQVQVQEINELYNTIADLDGIIETLEKKPVKKAVKKVAKKTVAKKKAGK